MKQILNRQRVLSFGLKVFKVFPVSSRFELGKFAVRMFKPIARKFSLFSPPSFALDTFDDYLWLVLFTSLTHHGIEFNPKIALRESKLDIPAGAIMVSGHFFLNYFVIRQLFDEGCRQNAVIRDEFDRHQVLGKKDTIDIIKPSPECLREIKKRLKSGEITSICVDHSEPFEGWQKLNVPDRRIYISDTIFKFAERFNVPLVFFGTHVNSKNEIEIHTARPVSKDSAEVTAEFGEFLKQMLSKSEK